MQCYPRHKQAFTLIELLVVVSIIALLVSVLLPSLNKAREVARRIKCAAGLNQVGLAERMYAGDNGGWFTPAVSGRFTYYDFTFDVSLDAYLKTMKPGFPAAPSNVFIDRRQRPLSSGIWECASDKVKRDPTNTFAQYRRPVMTRSYTMNALLVPNGSVSSTWGMSSKFDNVPGGVIMFSEFWHPYNCTAELLAAVSYICGESYPGILYNHDADGWPGHLGGVGNFLFMDNSVQCLSLKQTAKQVYLGGNKQYWSGP